MEGHEHKRQLKQMEADRIATLKMRLRMYPDNKLLKHYLSTYDKNNDNETTLRENQQNQWRDFS